MLELEVVARGVLEEARPLLARRALEAQRRLDDERNARGLHAVDDVLPQLLRRHLEPKVRHGHLVAVDGVHVVLGAVLLADPVHNHLMAVHRVVLPLCGGPALLEAQRLAVELLGDVDVVDLRVALMARYVRR